MSVWQEKLFDSISTTIVNTIITAAVLASIGFFIAKLLTEPQFEVPEFQYNAPKYCEFVIKNLKEQVECFYMILECGQKLDSASVITSVGRSLGCC